MSTIRVDAEVKKDFNRFREPLQAHSFEEMIKHTTLVLEKLGEKKVKKMVLEAKQKEK